MPPNENEGLIAEMDAAYQNSVKKLSGITAYMTPVERQASMRVAALVMLERLRNWNVETQGLWRGTEIRRVTDALAITITKKRINIFTRTHGLEDKAEG